MGFEIAGHPAGQVQGYVRLPKQISAVAVAMPTLTNFWIRYCSDCGGDLASAYFVHCIYWE